MTGPGLAELVPFATAIIGAAAALTGLLFVAVSLNLDAIVARPGYLPGRAAEALATLLLVLVSSALVLVPQDARLVGAEILLFAVPLLVVTTRNQLAQRRANPTDPVLWVVSRIGCTAVATVPATVAGLSLALDLPGGPYWLVGTALLGIIGAVYNAWVLLIEIIR